MLGAVTVVGHLVLLTTYYVAILVLQGVLRENHPAVELLLKVPTLPAEIWGRVRQVHDNISTRFFNYWTGLRHQVDRSIARARQGLASVTPTPIANFVSYVAGEVGSILPKVQTTPGDWLRKLRTSVINFSTGFTKVIVIFVLGAAVVVGFVLLLSLAYQDVQTFLSKRRNDLRSGIGGFLQGQGVDTESRRGA